MKTWFITGASTGLGRQYTLAALNRGDRVAAASIDPENMEDYKENYGDPALCAQALLKIVDSEEPPKEIALTSFANEILRIVTKERLDLADEWQEVTAMADIRQ